MSRVEITLTGVKKYRDPLARIHRDDGPAVIYPGGFKIWAKFGSSVRSLNALGIVTWFNKHQVSRINGVSIDHTNGYKQWYSAGKVIWPKL